MEKAMAICQVLVRDSGRECEKWTENDYAGEETMLKQSWKRVNTMKY